MAFMGSFNETGKSREFRHVALNYFSSSEARQPSQHTLDRRPVRRTDDASARKTRLNKYRLFLGELAKSELAMIVAVPGCADAAERQRFLGDVQQGIVHRHATGNG